MPLQPSVRFLPYLLDVFKSAVLKEIGIPIEKINHFPRFAFHIFLNGFLLFQGTEVIIREKEKEPNRRLQARDTWLRLYTLELFFDEFFQLPDVIRVVVLDAHNLTQQADVEYFLLGCLFLQNGSPHLR